MSDKSRTEINKNQAVGNTKSLFTPSPHSQVSGVQNLRIGVVSSILGLPNFYSRKDDCSCNMIYTSLTTIFVSVTVTVCWKTVSGLKRILCGILVKQEGHDGPQSLT